MYCPNCGRTNSAEQRFCRSCGLSLEKIVQSLTEQLPPGELDRKIKDRQRTLDRTLNVVGAVAVTIVVGAVFWGIIAEIIIGKGEVLAGSLFLAFVVGALIFALLSIYRQSLEKSLSRERMSRLESTAENQTSSLSQSSVKPMASVTEDTTELLAVQQEETQRTKG